LRKAPATDVEAHAIDKRAVYVPVNCWLGGRLCGLCCYGTEMILLPQDISELESLGYRREEFAVEKNGVYVLRNVDGHCIFLNPETNACTIYPHRPLGCRLYPLVYDVDRGVVTVDKLCPRWHEITRELITRYEPVFRAILEILERASS